VASECSPVLASEGKSSASTSTCWPLPIFLSWSQGSPFLTVTGRREYFLSFKKTIKISVPFSAVNGEGRGVAHSLQYLESEGL